MIVDAVDVGPEAGGKGAALARLARAGVRVPLGFVLPRSVWEAFAWGAVQHTIRSTLSGLDPSDPAALNQAAQALTECIQAAPWPAGLESDVRASLRALEPPYVVRSSALGEDAAEASFAGQLDSFLDLQDAEEVLAHIRLCWASMFSARSLAYQHGTGRPLDAMGVLVQSQVEGVVSGVLFTESPTDADALLLEACEGSCERLVSGEVVPETVWIPRGAVGECGVLTAPQLARLLALGVQLEQEFGAPQDIEWTLDASGVFTILQSRPITTEVAVFSNANINENYPGPVTPLLQSLAKESYKNYFRTVAEAYGFSAHRIEAMEDSLGGIVGVHAQRLYYDVSNIHAVLRMSPFGDTVADLFNRFVGVEVRTTAREKDVTWSRGRRGRTREAFELLAMARTVSREYRRLTAQVERFEQTVEDYVATTQDLESLDEAGLIARFEGFLQIRFQQWRGAALADGACMIGCGVLERFLDASFDESGTVLLHGLLRGLPDIVSSEPPKHLWRLSRQVRADPKLTELLSRATPDVLQALGWDGQRFGSSAFARAVQTFLDDWGFRCTGELMFSVDSFQDAPQAVIDMIRSYSQMEGDGPEVVIAQQGQAREAQTEALAASLPRIERAGFRWLVSGTARSLALRERARLKQALLYRRCRAVVLALGRRLTETGAVSCPEDLFFLTWQELAALASDRACLAQIPSRRARFDEESRWPDPPPRFRLARGRSWVPRGLPASQTEEGALTGLAAAAGTVTARATVAAGHQDFHRVAPGDVLVAPQTDPGWATVLFLVKGLVMERGGMLSHGAIIAREFGIPSVVAVKGAMTQIPQGATVMVDGDRGRVHVVD